MLGSPAPRLLPHRRQNRAGGSNSAPHFEQIRAAIAALKHLFLLYEIQGGRVYAIPQSGRPRTVSKHMTQVGSAIAAGHLGSRHPVTCIRVCFYVFAAHGRVEAWPAGPRVKLGIRAEQRIAATYAVEHPLVVQVVVSTRKRAFGSLSARNLVLLGSQLAPPFLVRLDDLIRTTFQYFICHPLALVPVKSVDRLHLILANHAARPRLVH